MSTLVYVASVVCGTGTTSPVLQSLSWRQRDDIRFFCFVRAEMVRSSIGISKQRGGRLIRMPLLTALSSNTTSCLGLHEQCATWNLEGRKLNTCNRTLIREMYWKQASSIISSKGPKIDNYRKLRNKIHYFRFVILSHNRFWGQIVEPIVETGLYPDLPND
jgi:hypothetical protein